MTLRNTQTSDTIEVMIKKVDPKKVYTATEIKDLGLIPWARDTRVIARILNSGIIEAEISGKNKQKRYLVKGKSIIKYIKKHGPALKHTIRKKKKNVKTRNKKGR